MITLSFINGLIEGFIKFFKNVLKLMRAIPTRSEQIGISIGNIIAFILLTVLIFLIIYGIYKGLNKVNDIICWHLYNKNSKKKICCNNCMFQDKDAKECCVNCFRYSLFVRKD